MRAPRAALWAVLSVALVSVACGGKGRIGGDDAGNGDGGGGPPDACVGLQCMEVNCAGQGIGTTRLSGTVYAPNGTLPLYNVNVYVPNADPGPIGNGLTCDRCGDQLPGSPVVKTITDELGHFDLDNVPVAPNIPVVVNVGKWRRQFTVATVNQCMDNPVPAIETTLPKDRSEGDMPNIAISTGSADALECLVRKLGIADKEITNQGGGGRVQLFAGNGTNSFDPGFANTGTFTKSENALWDSFNHLKNYDIVILSCEGSWPGMTRAPQGALDALYQYANMGGRVFLSHWHNYWIQNQAQVWPSIYTFAQPPGSGDTHAQTIQADIDQTTARGVSFFKWLGGPQVQALTAQNQLTVNAARDTALTVDTTKATQFVYAKNASGLSDDNPPVPVTLNGVQDSVFTTPNDAPADQRCGKVVFSDMHVASGSSSNATKPYPTGCAATLDLTPQEKALAFIFFDIASCVGPVVN
jgi:hypothetical protein